MYGLAYPGLSHMYFLQEGGVMNWDIHKGSNGGKIQAMGTSFLFYHPSSYVAWYLRSL